jgi:hypothetical protein
VAEDALPASLGLGASLVLLLSKSAAELSRMAELRAQMERLVMDASADVRSCNGRPSGSDGHTDSGSVAKEPFARAGDEQGGAVSQSAPASRGTSEDAGHRDMDRMEAELEAELSRLQLQQGSSDEEHASPWRDRELEVLLLLPAARLEPCFVQSNCSVLNSDRSSQWQPEAKSSASSWSRSAICSDSDNDGEIDDGEMDSDGNQGNDNEEGEEEEEDGDDESNAKSLPYGGVSARELERRLHELLQSRHEARIAELESELERARRKLRDTEREASRWRDTAKLATRFTDESRLRR